MLFGSLLQLILQTTTEQIKHANWSLSLTSAIYLFQCSIKILPAMAFENLNSLETLSIQNNKLQRIPEEVMEPIIDTLRVVDIMGKFD